MWYGVGCLGMIIFGSISLLGISNDSKFVFWFGVVGFAIFNFGALILGEVRKRRFAEDMDGVMDMTLNRTSQFAASQEFRSVDLESMIAIDETKQQVCFMYNTHDNQGVELSRTLSKFNYETKIFHYEDILQSEIIIDGVTHTKTSRSSQVGGAMIGSLVGGNVGAIIGGLSALQTSQTHVRSIQLQVVVNDPQRSFYRINFALFEQPVAKNSSSFIIANDKATHWHNLLSYLIKTVDQEEQTTLIESRKEEEKIFPHSSVVDELLKLSDLLEKKLISIEEYNHLKNKLLN